MSARHAAGMEVGDVLPVVTDGPDDVPLHDLHMVDVVEELHPRRAHPPHHRYAERGVISLVVWVIHLAVQQLETDGYPMLLGQHLDAVEPGNAARNRLGVAASATVAEHRDDVGHAVARREGD